MRLIMYQEDTERRTHARDHIIQVFAFFTFSSSPPDIKYIIPLSINAITAITATYLIPSAMIFATKLIGESNDVPSPHHGRSPQLISGAPANTMDVKKTDIRTI